MINEYSTDVERYIYNCFKDLHFDKVKHLYHIIRKGRQIYLPSVSSRVEAHAPKFNAELILPHSAKKEGVGVAELRQRWQDINREGCNLGTQTHDFLEKFTGIESPKTPQQKAGIAYIKSLAPKYRISFRELRAYSEEFLYAGTMDLPLEVVEHDSFEIADYKTNKDLFKAYDFLKPPFQTMEASAFNKIQIQLSYYQIMMEEKGIKISNRRLVHLLPTGGFDVYSLNDLTEELKSYMRYGQHRRSNPEIAVNI